MDTQLSGPLVRLVAHLYLPTDISPQPPNRRLMRTGGWISKTCSARQFTSGKATSVTVVGMGLQQEQEVRH